VPESAPRRVVLLHGLWMPGLAMQWLATRMRQEHYAPEIFSYHSVADGPGRAVPDLVAALRSGPACDIVAHSLGGLIALQALCDAPELAVGRVVCLGSPLTGSGAVGGMLRRAPVPAAALFGRSAQLLRDGVACWQGRAEVGMVAGRVPHGLGSLFADFTEDHDGTVGVAETRLPGLADHVMVDASHSGLLVSEAALAQVLAFLRQGRFLH